MTSTAKVEDHGSAPEKQEEASCTFRLTPFWNEDPGLWFLQTEALFRAHGVKSQQQRFNMVLGQLPYHVMTQVADLATTNSPTPYDVLKERLTTIYSQSEERRISKLLEETHLGDQKPSQLYRHLQTQAGATATPQMLKTVWLRALPNRVRSILAAIEKDDIDDLTKIADRILEVDTPLPVAAQEPASDPLRTMQEDIKQLKATLERLIRTTRKGDKRGRSTSRGRTPPRKNQSSSPGHCFYHERFGDKAQKCRQPCTWSKQEK